MLDIRKGDKFRYHLSKYENYTFIRLFISYKVYDDYYECQKDAMQQSKIHNLLWGIERYCRKNKLPTKGEKKYDKRKN